MRMKTLVLLLAEDKIVKELNNQTQEVAPRRVSSLDNFLQLLGLIVLLVVILFAAYYTSRLIGKVKLGQMKTSNFTVIDTYRISPGKHLQIVKIGEKYVVISISKDSINHITDLTEAELILKEQNPIEHKSFRQIIDSVRNKKE